MKKMLVFFILIVLLTACGEQTINIKKDPYVDANYAEITEVKFVPEGEPKTYVVSCGKFSCKVTDDFPEAYYFKIKYDNGLTNEMYMSKAVGEKLKVGDKIIFNTTIIHKERPVVRR